MAGRRPRRRTSFPQRLAPRGLLPRIRGARRGAVCPALVDAGTRPAPAAIAISRLFVAAELAKSSPAARREQRVEITSCRSARPGSPAGASATGRTGSSSGSRAPGTRASARAIRAIASSRGVGPRDQLRDQRVVEHRHLVSGRHPAVVAHARAGGRPQAADRARGRHEALVGILGVDAALDRVAVGRQRARRIDREPLAAREANLPVDEIDRRSPSPSPDARPAAGCSSRGSRTIRPRRAGTRSCRRWCTRPPWPRRRRPPPCGRGASGVTASDGDSSTTF